MNARPVLHGDGGGWDSQLIVATAKFSPANSIASVASSWSSFDLPVSEQSISSRARELLFSFIYQSGSGCWGRKCDMLAGLSSKGRRADEKGRRQTGKSRQAWRCTQVEDTTRRDQSEVCGQSEVEYCTVLVLRWP